MQTERTPRRVRIAPNLYQRPSDGKFEIGFADSAGRWRIKTLRARTRRDAKAERDAFMTKLRGGQVAPPSKITFAEAAAEYLVGLEAAVAAGEKASRTLERYTQHLDGHVVPALGPVQLQKLTPDRIASFLRDQQAAGLSSWTRKGMLTPMRRVLALAVRRGYMTDNPLRRLESEELPKGKAKDAPRVLDRDEIRRLLLASSSVASPYTPILTTKVFSGLRIMELLGLTWRYVDLDDGVIAVRCQLTRGTKENPAILVELKTSSARRDVVLLPELVGLLRTHRRHAFERGLARERDYVFATREGTAFNYRNVAQRGLAKAADHAGLNAEDQPRLTLHDLRHTFGSHLVRQGTDVVTVCRQMGHARPSITLDVYAHEFAAVQHRDSVTSRLNDAFSGILAASRI
jgi:integrase